MLDGASAYRAALGVMPIVAGGQEHHSQRRESVGRQNVQRNITRAGQHYKLHPHCSRRVFSVNKLNTEGPTQ